MEYLIGFFRPYREWVSVGNKSHANDQQQAAGTVVADRKHKDKVTL
jgi:hypothetical protein